MNNLWNLIKVDLRETLDVRRFKENKGKSISFFAFLALVLIGGLFLSVVYNVLFCSVFQYGGANLVYSTLMMGALSSILAFSTSVFKMKSIFIGKDYEMLRSMPIKKSTIIASKIINLYLVELLYTAIIMIPNVIINAVFAFDLTYLLFGLVITILIPALPMMVACLFSLFITLVADRFKFGNIINFLLYLIFFVAIMFFSFSMSYADSSLAVEGEEFDISVFISMAKNFAWVNPTLQLVKLSYLNNHLYIVLFIVANILLFVIVVSFVSLFLDKIHNLINSHKSNNVYVRKKLESKGQLKTLLANEYKRLFTSKYYFINSISSGICAIVISAILAFTLKDSFAGEEFADAIKYIKEYAFIGSIIIAFGIGISSPASASISIEGHNFWMIKAYPIDYKKLVLAKLIASISILGACSLISSIIIVAFIQPTLFASIMLIVTPLLFVILTSILGLLINLSFYKLKWKNEQECVKNSAGVIITMLIDWGITLVLAGALILLSILNVYVGGIVPAVMLLIGCIVLYNILMSGIDRKIERIEEF